MNFECLNWKYQKITTIWAINLLTKWIKPKYMYGCFFFNIWTYPNFRLIGFFFPKQMIKQYYSTYAHWIISIMSMACMHMKLDNFHYKHGMHAYEIQRRGHIFWFKIILKFLTKSLIMRMRVISYSQYISSRQGKWVKLGHVDLVWIENESS